MYSVILSEGDFVLAVYDNFWETFWVNLVMVVLSNVYEQGVPKNAPMLLESVETWGHFLWDTLYIAIIN